MSDKLQELLSEALINNTFSLDAIDDELSEELVHSYSYLYRLQRSLIDYDTFHFVSKKDILDTNYGDMYIDSLGRVCMTVEYDLVDNNNRDTYRNSPVYGKELTQHDILENAKIFSRTMLVMIDNKALFNFKIKMENNEITIIFPFKSSFIRNQSNGIINHTITIQVIPNTFIWSYTTNQNMLKAQSYNGSDINIVKGINYGMKPSDNEGLYFAFVRRVDDELSSSYQEVKINEYGDFVIEYTSLSRSLITESNTNVVITFVYFKDMYKHTMYANNDMKMVTNNKTNAIESKLAVIQREENLPYAMPIPTENMMILKKISTDNTAGEWAPVASIGSKLYYPNIYQVEDTEKVYGDEYKIFYFYQKNFVLSYEPKFNFFYKYLSDKSGTSIEEVLNNIYFGGNTNTLVMTDEFNAIFKNILNYDEYNHIYDIIEYMTKEQLKKTPIKYRVDKMRDFIKSDPFTLKEYVLKQNSISDTYYLYVKGIDLESRIRHNTNEDTNIDLPLDKECYVFSFQNPDVTKRFNYQIFIDGLMCMDSVNVTYKMMEYIYIPSSHITEDSYIEIELYHSFNATEDVYFPDMETGKYLIFSLDSGVTPTIQDLIFTDITTGVEYPLDMFNIHRIVDDVKYPLFRGDGSLKVEYSIADKLMIYPNNNGVLHKHIRIDINKSAYFIPVTLTRRGYPSISLSNYKFKFNDEYVKVFHNGRKIPRSMYRYKEVDGEMLLQFMYQLDAGDNVCINVSPYRNKMIYNVSVIPNFKTDAFMIDLTGYINKPFDIRYYDVYVNGKKLSEVNVHPITPTQIALTNLTSSKNLEIYEKDRDVEYFSVEFNNATMYFSIADLMNNGFISSDDRKHILDGAIADMVDENTVIKPNTDSDNNVENELENEVYLRIKIFYFEELIPLEFVNPDTKQFNNVYLQTDYPEITRNYIVDKKGIELTSNPLESTNVLLLNPDTILKGNDQFTSRTVLMTGGYEASLYENE